MGHVVNPISYRLYNIRFWNSSWFNNKNFGLILNKDFLIFKYISKFFKYNQNYFFSHILLTRFYGILKIDLFVYDYIVLDSFDNLKRKLKFNFYKLGKKKFLIRYKKENNFFLNKFNLIKLTKSFNNITKFSLLSKYHLFSINKFILFNNLLLNNINLNYQRYCKLKGLINTNNLNLYESIFKNLVKIKKLKLGLKFRLKKNLLLNKLNLNLNNFFFKISPKPKFKKFTIDYHIIKLRKLSYRWNLYNFIKLKNYFFINKSQSFYYDFLLNSQKILYFSFKSKLNYFFKLHRFDKNGYKVRRLKRKFLKKKKFLIKIKFNLKKKFLGKKKLNIKRYFWKKKKKKNFFLTKVLFFNKKIYYNLWYLNNLISINFYKKNKYNFSYYITKTKFKLYPLNLKKKLFLINYFDNLSNLGNKLDSFNYKLKMDYKNLLNNFQNLPYKSVFINLNLEKKKFNFSKRNYRFKIYNYNKFRFILRNSFSFKTLFNSRLKNKNFLKYYNWSNLVKLNLKQLNLLKTNKINKFYKKKKKKLKLKTSLFILQKYLNYRKNFIINNFILKQVSVVSLLKSISLKKIIFLVLILKKNFKYFNNRINILKNSYFYLLFLNLNKILLKKKINLLTKTYLKFTFFKKLNIRLIINNIKLKYSNFFFYFFYKVYFLKSKLNLIKINLKKNYFFFERLKKEEIIILYKQLVKIENHKIKLNFNIIREPTASMVNIYLKRNLKKQSSLNRVIYPILRSIVHLYKNIIGIQINVSGRFTKKRRKSYLWYRFGNVKIGTQTSLIDFSKNFVILRFGVGGTKVWLYYKKPIKMLLQSSY